jgi:hypothetical protein
MDRLSMQPIFSPLPERDSPCRILARSQLSETDMGFGIGKVSWLQTSASHACALIVKEDGEMGCLRSLTIVGTILCNFLAMGWMALVLGTANTLGNAALVSKDDAIVGFILLVIALFGNALLSLLLLIGRRARRAPTAPSGIEIMPQRHL